MELLMAISVSGMAVLVALLSIVTGRQQKEIESLWKEIRGLNDHIIADMKLRQKLDEGTRAAFEIQGEINEMFLKIAQAENG